MPRPSPRFRRNAGRGEPVVPGTPLAAEPSSPVIFEAGPFVLRYYGLFVVLGIAVGTWITGLELARRGYDGALALDSLFFVVPLGLAGARIYHVATDYDQYSDRLAKVFFFWFGAGGSAR